MADYLEFAGRQIEAVPFTGLLERLTQIGLMAGMGTEAEQHLSKAHLVSIIRQIHQASVEAIAFSGATQEEAQQMNRHLMKHMKTDFE